MPDSLRPLPAKHHGLAAFHKTAHVQPCLVSEMSPAFWTKARHGPSGSPVGILLIQMEFVVVIVLTELVHAEMPAMGSLDYRITERYSILRLRTSIKE